MNDLLARLGLSSTNPGAWAGAALPFSDAGTIASFNPATGLPIAEVALADVAQYEKVVAEAERAFAEWRMYPAPKRGEIVRQIGEAFRAKKEDLGALVSLEVGKIRAEGQEIGRAHV